MSKDVNRGPSDQERRTPPWLFELLQKQLKARFQLDAAANAANALCKSWCGEEEDGLTRLWARYTFCNPPFKRFGLWLQKAYDEVAEGRCALACVVGPVGCSQSWYHDWALLGTIFAPDDRIVYFDRHGQPTPGGDRDSNIYVFGESYWNSQANIDSKIFNVRALPVRGLVERISRPKKAEAA